MHKPRVDVDII